MPPYSKRTSNLAGREELIWKLWFELGTLELISRRLFEMGVNNPKNGKPVSRWGLEIAAWRYACENIAQAKQDFKDSYLGRQVPFDDTAELNFYRRLITGAKAVYTGKSLERWIANNDLESYRKFL